MIPARPPHGHRAQRGISLIVSLVLLVVVTLIALGSMRGVVLQARMSGTTHDRSLAFEAAEAALREAERRAATATAADIPANGCVSGYCATPALADTPRWLDDAFAGWRAAGAAAPADAPVPEAIVEDMGDAPNWMGCESEIPRQPNCSTRRYRISARSTADGRASVLVQSQYAAP
jgi:type IV pilus assembly protein PilX